MRAPSLLVLRGLSACRRHLEAGELVLNVIEDSCSFGLRGQNLSNQSWLVCQSSSQAAVDVAVHPGVVMFTIVELQS